MSKLLGNKERILLGFFLAVAISGCNTLNRLSDLGAEPKISTIQNPTTKPDYKPISMPMPFRFVAIQMTPQTKSTAPTKR